MGWHAKQNPTGGILHLPPIPWPSCCSRRSGCIRQRHRKNKRSLPVFREAFCIHKTTGRFVVCGKRWYDIPVAETPRKNIFPAQRLLRQKALPDCSVERRENPGRAVPSAEKKRNAGKDALK